MTPERLAEIEMVLTKRFDLLHPTWLYAACIDLLAALDACERLRAAAEADADAAVNELERMLPPGGPEVAWRAKVIIKRRRDAAAVALRLPVTP